MILGIDIGNYSVKVEPNINFKSLVTTEEANILGGSTVIEYDGKRYVVGEGEFETELNKTNKENFLPLLFTAIAQSSNDTFNQVVCGLPINQYKANKEKLKKLISENKMKTIKINGQKREIVISEFEVYPEGVGAYYSFYDKSIIDVIIVDIGGRTTDIAYISKGKLLKSATVSVGTLNIYNEIADKINSYYSLNLDIEFIDNMMETGYLKVDNKEVDLSFVTEILKKNFLIIKKELDLNFPARTVNILLEGGGAKLFKKAFKNRYDNSDIASEPLYANAIGFKKVGEKLWG